MSRESATTVSARVKKIIEAYLVEHAEEVGSAEDLLEEISQDLENVLLDGLGPDPRDVANIVANIYTAMKDDPEEYMRPLAEAAWKKHGRWIDLGEGPVGVDDIHEYGELPQLDLNDGTEWMVAEDNEAAGEAAKKRWKDMAKHDPKEFATMVGEDTLVSWALGHSAGPGAVSATSLDEWLDVVADHPEEEFASYDSTEVDVKAVSEAVVDELGFEPTVAYRHN